MKRRRGRNAAGRKRKRKGDGTRTRLERKETKRKRDRNAAGTKRERSRNAYIFYVHSMTGNRGEPQRTKNGAGNGNKWKERGGERHKEERLARINRGGWTEKKKETKENIVARKWKGQRKGTGGEQGRKISTMQVKEEQKKGTEGEQGLAESKWLTLEGRNNKAKQRDTSEGGTKERDRRRIKIGWV